MARLVYGWMAWGVAKGVGLGFGLGLGLCLGLSLSAILATSDVHAAAAAAQCGPSLLGAPCAQDGVATQAEAGAATSLGIGNPVNLATGNKYQREVDLPALPGVLGVELIRHYNARDLRADALGRNWVWSYDTRLFRVGDSVQIVQADGSRVDFARGSAGATTCMPSDPALGVLHVRPGVRGETMAWQWRDGRVLSFDEDGFLAGISVASGQLLRIRRARDAGRHRGALLEVIDPHGRRLQIDYGEGQTRVRDAAGGVTRLTHRQAGARTVLTTVEGVGCEDCAPVDASRRYDASGRLTQAAGIGVERDILGRVALLREAGVTTRVAWLADSTLPTQVDAPSSVAGQRHVRRIDWLQFSDPATGLWRAVPKRIAEAGWRPGPAGPQAIQRAWVLDWRLERGVATLAGAKADSDAAVTSRVASAPSAAHASLPAIDGWPDLRWRRDDFGLPVLAEGAGGRSVAGAESRDYDPAGRLVARVFADGTRWTYAYDSGGRLQVQRAQRGRETIETTLFWQGDLPVRIAHPMEAELRSYGPDGHMQRREVARPANLNGEAGGAPVHYAETFDWDTRGRMQRHELPEGGSVFYDWSAQGLAAIRYVPPGGPEIRMFSQTASGGKVSRRWFNGVVSMSHPDGTQHYLGGSQGLLALARRVDRQGRVLVETSRRPGPASVLPAAAAEVFASSRYAYDAAGRLIAAVHAGGQGNMPALWPPRTADYFAWRNGGEVMAQAHHGMTTRPTRIREPGGLPRRADGLDLRYGPSRRLIAVDRAGVAVARYAHNAFGERIVRQVGAGAPTHDFYLGQQLVAEQGSGPPGTIARRYLYAGPELVAILDYSGGRPLLDPSAPKQETKWFSRIFARPASPEVRVLAVHPDAIGAPRLVTDADQHERWRGDFSPFGALRGEAGDIAMRMRLPGQVFDAETGWHDNYLRTYDPHAGSYLEPDPLGAEPGTEAYGYAAQQPARFIDPLGLLLFAFDGTRNAPSSRTNIFLMSQWYRDTAISGDVSAALFGSQAVHYVSGPGSQTDIVAGMVDTSAGTTVAARIATQWDGLVQELSVRGADKRDPLQIDIIGFSRGAAAARDFANRIANLTVNGRLSLQSPSGNVVSACINLRFLGLFDTVAQMGIDGKDDAEFDFTIAPGWDQVAQIVALSERRYLFPSTLTQTQEGNAAGVTSSIKEIGLIGAHSDIGGGYTYEQNGAVHGDLSDVALAWMLNQARATGLDFSNVPTAYRTVTDPLVHQELNARPFFREVDGDRRMFFADGGVAYTRQDYHPSLGKTLRDDLEAFIVRDTPWSTPTGPAVGYVRMFEYQQWLARNVGVQMLP